MSLPYEITEDKKTINIKRGYINYLNDIQKEITDNQIKTLMYNSFENIGSNFNFPNNPIEEIIYKNIDFIEIQNFNNLPEKLNLLKIHLRKIKCYKMNNLPKGLKILHLPIYHHKLDNLPLELEHLHLSIDNTFAHSFDYLPDTLKILSITNYDNIVNINIDNLPNGLEKLLLGDRIYCGLNNLPRNLKTLHLTKKNIDMINNLPDELEELNIPINYKYLKNIVKLKKLKKLKKIFIGQSCSFDSSVTSSFDLKSIPNSVEEIVFGDNFNQKLSHLPSKVKKITFGFNFNHLIDYGDLPDSIEYLEFTCNFNQAIVKYPSNLKVLKFGENHPAMVSDGHENFNYKFKNLPTTLEILKFSEYSRYSYFGELELPDSIKILQLGKNFLKESVKIYLQSIPKSLEYIKYDKSSEKITELIKETGWTGKIEYWK